MDKREINITDNEADLNTTDVIDIDPDGNGWLGEIRSASGDAVVTVKSVTALFSRSPELEIYDEA